MNTSAPKSIEAILNRPAHFGMVGDGFRVYNYFPNGYRIRERMDPFLMLDFNPEYDFGPSNHPRGVDVHPHKGFETVTIAYKGSVAHYDSTGKSGVINPGDVQWMTAGGGILHKEFHETAFSKKGGPFEMVQLWVNLPAKDKQTPAKYQALEAERINKLFLDNHGGVVKVIAGTCNGVTGSATTFTEMNVLDIRLKAQGKLVTRIPATHNTGILVIDGGAEINGRPVTKHQFVLFKNEGDEITVQAAEESVLLLLSGFPINEPVAQYGPFVMNTQEELQLAFQEFQSGKFGVLE